MISWCADIQNTKYKIQTTKARPRKVRGLKRNTKLKKYSKSRRRKQEHWGRSDGLHGGLSAAGVIRKCFFDWRNSANVRRVSRRVDVTWRWNTADVKNIVLMVRNSPKSGCLVRSWNDLIKCRTTSSRLPCCSHIQTWCTWRKWTFLYLTLCLFRLIWQFLSRHSALLTLWLGLGTNTIQSGWEQHRALLSNGCFCRHDHGWRRSDLPSAAFPPPSDVKCG